MSSNIKIDFSSYVLMLASAGFIALGKVAHPTTGETSVDINQAKYIIDILEMLQEKTKGNLTPEEEKQIKDTLTNLRYAFVEVAGKEKNEIKESS